MPPLWMLSCLLLPLHVHVLESRPLQLHSDAVSYLQASATIHPAPANHDHQSTQKLEDSYPHDNLQAIINHCLCEPGHEPVRNCSSKQSAVCRPCPPGHFSSTLDTSSCQRCPTCPEGSLQVAPCKGTQPPLCIERYKLRIFACTFVKHQPQRTNIPRVVTERVSSTTPSEEIPPEDVSYSGTGTSVITHLFLYVPVVFLLVIILQLFRRRRGIIRLPLLVPFMTPRSGGQTHRQADYFHMASSCYQIGSGQRDRSTTAKSGLRTLVSSFLSLLRLQSRLQGSPLLSDLEEDGDEKALSLESARRDRRSNSYEVYCPVAPQAELALDASGFYRGTFTWEGGTLAHKTVAMTICKMAIPTGHAYTIKGKTHTDLPNWWSHTNAERGDVIIAPILEFHIDGDHVLNEHVNITVPHCEPRNHQSICVYWGDTYRGYTFETIPHMNQKKNNSDVFYSADENYVYIHTKHFRRSQFICTIGDRQISLQLQVLVFVEHQVRSDSQELKLKVKLCDSRNQIPDLRQAYFEQEAMILVESCSWKRLELPNNEVTPNSEVCIELQPLEHWRERVIGELRFPLKMTSRLVDVLHSQNNLLAEFSLTCWDMKVKHFSGALLLRVTERIQEMNDTCHTVVSEGCDGVIQRMQSCSHTIETNKSCKMQIKVNITLDGKSKPRWSIAGITLQQSFDFIVRNLTLPYFPSFYRKLGLIEADVDNIKERYRDNFSEQKMQVLLEWQQRMGHTASVAELLEALRCIGLRKLAEDLEYEGLSSDLMSDNSRLAIE